MEFENNLEINETTAVETETTQTALPKENISVPRIDPETIKTTIEAEQFFISEITRRYRFNQFENALEKLNDDEMIDALYDCLAEINETTPQTTYSLLDMVAGHRYRRLLMIGAARNCCNTLVSIWASNGIDVSVEDLSVQNKFSDIQSLYSHLKEQFDERLKELKNYDRLTVKSTTYSTGGRRYGRAGGRLSAYTTGGRFLG